MEVRFLLAGPTTTNMDNEKLNSNLLVVYAKFPRVGKNIEFLWGQKEFPSYIVRTIADDSKDNSRQGFPPDVVMALMALQDLHDDMFPQFSLNGPDDWGKSAFGSL